MSERFDLDGEVVAEENAAEAVGEDTVRAIEPFRGTSPALRTEVRTAAIAAAGGALAGAVTVAAVRAVAAVGSGSRRATRRAQRRKADRPANVIASRSFLVDVHLLGR